MIILEQHLAVNSYIIAILKIQDFLVEHLLYSLIALRSKNARKLFGFICKEIIYGI